MNTITIKTHNLTGPALDWAVAKAEGYDPGWLVRQLSNPNPETRAIPGFSADWSVGGPIIERVKMGVFPLAEGYGWAAGMQSGPTPLIAAMRCYVAYVLGDTVEVPEELV